jgi:hypothetical protein
MRREEDGKVALLFQLHEHFPDGHPRGGSRPVVGSSRKKILGSWTRPLAISSRRRMPPE